MAATNPPEPSHNEIIEKINTLQDGVDVANRKLKELDDAQTNDRYCLSGIYLFLLIGITIAVFCNSLSIAQATVLCFVIGFGCLLGIAILVGVGKRENED